ncbi:MAG: hypothetical protein WDZ94_00275, partial [Patescibacteria group bacterium]
MRNSLIIGWLSIYFFILVAFAFFSFIFTDPNLVLSQWQPYWQFQTWVWQVLLPNKTLIIWMYLSLIIGLFICYGKLIVELRKHKKRTIVWWKHGCIYLLLLVPLLFSYNAFSHDVFNYMFNAKMVVQYGENPHTSVALSYPEDEWTRFMHNTHTPAPYGYSWTAVSLLPFLAGQNIFIVTWLLFRLFAVMSIFLLYFSLQFLSEQISGRKRYLHEMALLLANPLLILEIVSNSHNDLWIAATARANGARL